MFFAWIRILSSGRGAGKGGGLESCSGCGVYIVCACPLYLTTQFQIPRERDGLVKLALLYVYCKVYFLLSLHHSYLCSAFIWKYQLVHFLHFLKNRIKIQMKKVKKYQIQMKKKPQPFSSMAIAPSPLHCAPVSPVFMEHEYFIP